MGKTAKDIRRMSREVIGPIPPARTFSERRMDKYKDYKFLYEDGWYDGEYDDGDMWNVYGDSEDNEEGESEDV